MKRLLKQIFLFTAILSLSGCGAAKNIAEGKENIENAIIVETTMEVADGEEKAEITADDSERAEDSTFEVHFKGGILRSFTVIGCYLRLFFAISNFHRCFHYDGIFYIFFAFGDVFRRPTTRQAQDCSKKKNLF